MANDIEINLKTVYDGSGMERAKQQMTGDARAAGAEVEQVLGQAGREAGDEMGEGIAQGLGDIDIGGIGRGLGDSLLGLVRAGGPLIAVAGSIAAAFGDEFMDGLSQGMNASRGAALRAIRTGLDVETIGRLGDEAGSAYAEGFGESLTAMKDVAATVEQNLRGIDDSLDTAQITRYAATFEEAFGITVPEQTRLARRLIANELAPDTVAAYDLMGEAAVRFGDQLDQGMDVLVEFSPIMSAMGIDGASAVALIGTSIENELFTNIDRAGDMWLELRNRVVASDDAREAIQGLGIDFQSLRDDIAAGGQVGEDALSGLIDGLLQIDNDADLATAAVEIFGIQMEEVADPRVALELFQQALALEEVGTSAQEMADELEGGATEWDKFKRSVTTGAAEMGEGFAGAANALVEFRAETQKNDWVDRFVAGFGQGVPELERFEEAELSVTEQTAALAAEFIRSMGTADDQRAAFEAAMGITRDLGDSIAEVTEEVSALDDALSDFADRFNSDRIFRSIDDDVRRLIESATDLEQDVYDVATGFDTTTAAGSKLESQVENLSSNLDTATQAFLNGEISGNQFKSAQDNVEAGLRAVAAQLNLTAAETEDLIATYGRVPEEVNTRAELDAIQALGVADRMEQRLNDIDGRTTSSRHNHSINTHFSTTGNRFAIQAYTGRNRVVGAAGGSGAPQAYQGGTSGVADSLAVVNDGSGGFGGLESARLPSGDVVSLPAGTTINTAEDTQRLLTEPGAAGGGNELHVHVHAGAVIDAERGVVEIIREAFENGDFDQNLAQGGH